MEKMFLFPLLILAATLNVATAHSISSVSCLDEDGNPIDWYIVYKLPQLITQSEPYNSGYAYMYITSNDIKLNKVPPIISKEVPETTEYEDSSFTDRFVNLLQKYIGTFQLSRRRPVTRSSRASVKPSKSAEVKEELGIEPKDLRWTVSKKSVVDPKSMVLRTLAFLYDKKRSSLNSILYNDGPPETFDDSGVKVNTVRAHAKGVVMIDDTTNDSVWVTHSFPQFPPTRDEGLNLGDNFKRKGQTLMCVSFDADKSGKQIINHLINMFPLVYDSYISDRLYSKIPELRNLKLNSEKGIRKRRKDDEPRLAQTITTMGGMSLDLFSKSSGLREDMYASWINDELESKLYVETWRTGRGNALNSSCPRDDYHVNNVQEMRLDTGNSKITWSYTMDHSKWAISDNQEAGLVCITDVNRMQSQFRRGGGAVCFKCSSCWSVFSKLINEIEPCPVKSH